MKETIYEQILDQEIYNLKHNSDLEFFYRDEEIMKFSKKLREFTSEIRGKNE